MLAFVVAINITAWWLLVAGTIFGVAWFALYANFSDKAPGGASDWQVLRQPLGIVSLVCLLLFAGRVGYLIFFGGTGLLSKI